MNYAEPSYSGSSSVTSKKLRSELLSEKKLSEQFFESLLESAPDAMVIVDQSGEIAIVNVQAEELFGYTREEMQGKKMNHIGLIETLVITDIQEMGIENLHL